MIRVCFVCLGNICRSPTAEGIMLHLVAEQQLHDHFVIDSAGTSAFHTGERADSRSRATAHARGIELPSRARQFEPADFSRFDYVMAMDRSNLRDLQRLTHGQGHTGKLHLLRSFDAAAGSTLDVPDPYHSGLRGFEDVFEICLSGCQGLLRHIVDRHGLNSR